MKKNVYVLIVEDEVQIRDLLSENLALVYEKVFTATNGIEAIEIIKNENIDIVITDLNMPNMDGAKLIDYIVDIKDNRLIPVIIHSAYANITCNYTDFDCISRIDKPLENFTVLIQEIDDLICKRNNSQCSEVIIERLKKVNDKVSSLIELIQNGK